MLFRSDGLVVQNTVEKADSVRLRIGQAVTKALAQKVLDSELLAASAQRLDAARTSAARDSQ